MSQLGKWIDGLAPESSVSEAARLSLDARLSAVTYWLPLAATYSHYDIEYVHRLRVSTRRTAAALRLYRDWLPRRRARWLKRRLHRIRQAAGDARDLDVLADRLRRQLGPRGEDLLADVMRRRAAAQPAIRAERDRACRGDRMRRKIGKLLGSVTPRGEVGRADRQRTFRDWAVQQLRTTAERFFAAVPSDDSDRAALHQFRIRGKALRYAVELLAPAFGPELRELHYPVIEELQEQLGQINDYVAGAERLRHWCDSAGDPERVALLREFIELEQAQLEEMLDQFRQWWTSERVETLRQGLLGGRADDQSDGAPAAKEAVFLDTPSPAGSGPA
jgi:CHAD domain-containing protein